MTPWGGLIKMTAWLIVVLLMVVFLYTMLADPVSGAGPASGSQAAQSGGTETIGSPPAADNGKRDDRTCLEKFPWDR